MFVAPGNVHVKSKRITDFDTYTHKQQVNADAEKNENTNKMAVHFAE